MMKMPISLPKASRLDSQEGFAFVMALMVMLLLTSLGVLVFLMTMKDQITSAKLTAEEKSLAAVEYAYSIVLRNFAEGKTSDGWQQVSSSDPDTQYYYSIPTAFANCPSEPGHNVSSTVGKCYTLDIRGRNVNFVGEQRVQIGVRTTVMGSSSVAEY
jgi:Tfp pilus assembly protein PilX